MNDCVGYHEDECINCGVSFQMTSAVYNQRQKDGAKFYCPNGHGQHYTRRKNSEKRLEARVAQLEADVKALEQTIRWMEIDLNWERKSSAAYRGHLHRVQRAQA